MIYRITTLVIAILSFLIVAFYDSVSNYTSTTKSDWFVIFWVAICSYYILVELNNLKNER